MFVVFHSESLTKLFKILRLSESYFCFHIFPHPLCFPFMKQRDGVWVSPQENNLSYEAAYCKGLP